MRRGLDDTGSIDLFVLPRVSSERCGGSEPAGGASLLSDMVGVAAAPPASYVGSLSPSFAERGGSLGHG